LKIQADEKKLNDTCIDLPATQGILSAPGHDENATEKEMFENIQWVEHAKYIRHRNRIKLRCTPVSVLTPTGTHMKTAPNNFLPGFFD